MIIELQALDEPLTHRDNGVSYVPNMTISPERLPKTIRTNFKAPILEGWSPWKGDQSHQERQAIRELRDTETQEGAGAPGQPPEGKK